MPRIELRVHKVHCIDETGGSWFTERGQDDINLAVVMVDYRGGVGQSPLLKVPHPFDDNETYTFEPLKVLAGCNVPGSTPDDYVFATVVLIDRDGGGSIADFMTNLERETRAALPSVVRGRALSTGDTSDEGLSRQVVVAAIKTISKWAAEAIAKAREDDFFPPKIVQTVLRKGKLSSTKGSVDFEGHNGRYRVEYHWIVK